jgi:uncharacterized membrane protein YraQ (UPF0718 family)
VSGRTATPSLRTAGPATPGVLAIALGLVANLVILIALAHSANVTLATPAAVESWSTVFLAICFQAAPFLAGGVLLAGLIITLVPRTALGYLLPRKPAWAVVSAGMAGLILPGCECASVPVARSLMAKGIPVAPALTFMLAAPAVNPIVLLATWVAFPAQPMMVVARFVAGLLTAIIVGWLFLRLNRWITVPTVQQADESASRRPETFRRSAVHDLVHAGGFLVLGAAIAATVATSVPIEATTAVANSGFLSYGAAGAMAVVAAICSEADAFIAASFTEFTPTALLVFLTVGPMVDLKLIGMQAGVFGGRFALRFAPLTFVTAIIVAALVGAVLL